MDHEYYSGVLRPTRARGMDATAGESEEVMLYQVLWPRLQHFDQGEDRVEIRKRTPTASHCAHVSRVVPPAAIVGCDQKGDEMHPLDDAREVSVNRGGVLGRVSSAGLIGNAMTSANVSQAVAAPSGAAAVIAAKTGTDVRSLTLSANGIRQHYLEVGSGPPVVLLHGFPETNYAWRYQIPVLARHYRVIAPDLRGYGETDKPASGYDKRTMANDLRE